MIIGKDFIFFHMPRTGGTFITDYFVYNPTDAYWQVDAIRGDGAFITSAAHAGPVHLVEHDFLQKRFWFAFIRNPFDWYVSKWANRFGDKNFKSWLVPLLYEENFLDSSKFVAHSIRYVPNLFPGGAGNLNRELPNQIVGWDFSNAINPLGVKFDVGFMTHRYLQVCCAYPLVYFEKWPERTVSWVSSSIHKPAWIEKHEELCLMDKVYKFEDGIASGLKDALGAEVDDSHRVNTSKHKPYQEYYDQELIDLVYYKDRFIFNAYGYTF